jgi:diaminopimelate dehydrogenase
VKRLRLAIVGFGRLGRACAEAAFLAHDLELAGVVVRHGPAPLPAPFSRVPVAAHLRELPPADATLSCVPAGAATGVAALRHRVAAVVGAGWDPGVFPLLRRTFELLIPDGRTESRDRPGASLHHTEAARSVPGVADALATEARDASGALRRYVYVELRRGAAFEPVRDAFSRDPLFAGEETQVFPVDSIASLEQAARGVVLERLGTARGGAHQNLLLEARFEAATFAARVMLDAARRLGSLRPGAHRYSLWP